MWLYKDFTPGTLMDDALCLEMLMNNSKHKRKNKTSDAIMDNPFQKGLRKALESLEPMVLASPTVLSNFEVFLQRLVDDVTRLVEEFEKDVHGKLD